MIDQAQGGWAFDAAFQSRAPDLSVRPETSDDAPFLRELFLAGYNLRDALPAAVLDQQADLRLAAFRENYRDAMRRIVVGPAGAIGRFIVDWESDGGTFAADLAVLPAYGRRGVGTALLRAWIDVAEAHGLACALVTEADNPARALYARLGFVETPDEDIDWPSIAMSRPCPR